MNMTTAGQEPWSFGVTRTEGHIPSGVATFTSVVRTIELPSYHRTGGVLASPATRDDRQYRCCGSSPGQVDPTPSARMVSVGGSALVLHEGEAAGEEATLGPGASEVEGPAVGGGRLVPASEAGQQVGAGAVEQVVAIEVAVGGQGIEQVQP